MRRHLVGPLPLPSHLAPTTSISSNGPFRPSTSWPACPSPQHSWRCSSPLDLQRAENGVRRLDSAHTRAHRLPYPLLDCLQIAFWSGLQIAFWSSLQIASWSSFQIKSWSYLQINSWPGLQIKYWSGLQITSRSRFQTLALVRVISEYALTPPDSRPSASYKPHASTAASPPTLSPLMCLHLAGPLSLPSHLTLQRASVPAAHNSDQVLLGLLVLHHSALGAAHLLQIYRGQRTESDDLIPLILELTVFPILCLIVLYYREPTFWPTFRNIWKQPTKVMHSLVCLEG
ncbi:hypothetical protein ZIOFF_003078 [Zingiber officinale]|uniref:Uncharacterized protein n=1 Tax=Zingiber officinale TaxID=94328 RepID=A0A8J5M9V4_ZINOF|nr:hypothetical protein ZIOFF_003078 [Zingiber officinale]